MRQRWQRPREGHGHLVTLFGLIAFGELQHLVLERKDDPRVDLDRQVELDRATARFFGVEVDLPRLTHGVRLDEVSLVVDVEAVVGRVVLEVGYEAGDIDDCHHPPDCQPIRLVRNHVARGPVPSQAMSAPSQDDPAVRRLRDLLDRTVAAIADALAADAAAALASWREKGERPGQYRIDLVADAAALEVLRGAGVGILSEESGLDDRGNGVFVVVDPVDGSTNASRGLPWYATSLCAVDEHGPVVALVVNLATGTRYTAVRGGGAFVDGLPVRVSTVERPADALVVVNGYPIRHLGWRQYRALGATALDLCSVADGSVDATIDCAHDALGPWDFLGGALLITEAGGFVADVHGRSLHELGHDVRRTPVSAATSPLFDELLDARRSLDPT